MLRIWRCHYDRCPGDPHDPAKPMTFEAKDGVCPRCKADVRKPGYRGVVALIERIHLMVRSDEGMRRFAACDPTIVRDGKVNRGTGEPNAVTCPQCQQTEVYRKLAEENGFEGHAPRVVDPV